MDEKSLVDAADGSIRVDYYKPGATTTTPPVATTSSASSGGSSNKYNNRFSSQSRDLPPPQPRYVSQSERTYAAALHRTVINHLYVRNTKTSIGVEYNVPEVSATCQGSVQRAECRVTC